MQVDVFIIFIIILNMNFLLWEVIKHITHFINFAYSRSWVWDRSVGVRCQKHYKQATFYKHKNDLICPRVIFLTARVHVTYGLEFFLITSQFTKSHDVWSKLRLKTLMILSNLIISDMILLNWNFSTCIFLWHRISFLFLFLINWLTCLILIKKLFAINSRWLTCKKGLYYCWVIKKFNWIEILKSATRNEIF